MNIVFDEDMDSQDANNLEDEHKERQQRGPRELTDYTADDGSTKPMTPCMMLWFNMYIAYPRVECECFQKKFQRCFHLPYAQFRELYEELEMVELFSRWHDGTANAALEPSSPISLLLLAALRYLGHGLTFDDLSENTGVSEDVIHVFLHTFLEYGSTVLYQRYVMAPTTVEEAASSMKEFAQAGYPGAVGSTDATHIQLEHVYYHNRQTHIGFKMMHTAHMSNVTVNHR